jgi:diguanylate cyclase (GGDEF)-like protein
MASASPTGDPPGCGVDSPDHCPAARRAQIQHFDDSEALDACPKLRDRRDGRLSALCVPVSIMGRTVGVIHATGAPGHAVDDDAVQDLATLAKLAGARIGLLRVMAETQLQASVDSLTGLLNRRSFEQRVAALRRANPTVAVAMADLDAFKELNDTYGHDTGDKALRLFAQVLRDSVRALDVTSRHGGEEFAVVFPGCRALDARTALDSVRGRLDAALTVAGLPRFTASFGVVDATEDEDLTELLARADAALFEAKRLGRNCVVVHDTHGATVPPGPGDHSGHGRPGVAGAAGPAVARLHP